MEVIIETEIEYWRRLEVLDDVLGEGLGILAMFDKKLEPVADEKT
jgi:hypothetical protein